MVAYSTTSRSTQAARWEPTLSLLFTCKRSSSRQMITSIHPAFLPIINVVVAVNKLQSMQRADQLVKVDVSRSSAIDYTEYNDLIEQGYQAAEQCAKLLNPFWGRRRNLAALSRRAQLTTYSQRACTRIRGS